MLLLRFFFSAGDRLSPGADKADHQHRPLLRAQRAPRPPCRPAQTSTRGASLFDHLVGAGEDRRRHGEAERSRGLEVYDQLQPRRLLNWEIGGLGALEDSSSINAGC